MPSPKRNVLFLCTGNYYRSRFAEMLFNVKAEEAHLPWHASSRALGIQMGRSVNVGPISSHTIKALQARGIQPPADHRFPQQVSEEDLAQSDLVIAVKEAEHRPLLQRLHPDWANRVEYWHVHDLDAATPEVALAELDKAVEALVQQLMEISQGTL
jgi:protein-tyrosine phosphatase